MFIESPRFFDEWKLGSSGGGPGFSTSVVRTKSGYDKRQINWNVPLQKFRVDSGVKTETFIYDLYNLFMVMRAQGHGFRVKNWFDFNSSKPTLPIARTDQVLATATAGQTQVQIIKTYSVGIGGLDLVKNITKLVVGTVIVDLDGADDTANWTVNHNTGLMTHAALTGGEIVSAGFEFDVPVRFAIDDWDAVLESIEINTVPEIPLIELRDGGL